MTTPRKRQWRKLTAAARAKIMRRVVAPPAPTESRDAVPEPVVEEAPTVAATPTTDAGTGEVAKSGAKRSRIRTSRTRSKTKTQ